MSDDQPKIENPERRVRVPWRWSQFRLRSLLVIVAIFAIVAAIMGRSLYVQQRYSTAVTAVKDLNGRLITGAGRIAKDGDRIERVFLSGINDEQLQSVVPHLVFLPHLRQLDVVESDVTDNGLQALSELRKLERLFVYQTRATPEGLASLNRRLPKLDVRQQLPDPIATGLAMRPIYRHAIVALKVSPNGRWLAAGDGRGRLWLWQLDARGLPQGLASHIQAHESWLFDVAFSSDSRLLATGGGDNQINIWDVKTLRPLATLTGHTDDVHAITFAENDRKLWSTGDDMTVRIWDVTSRTLERTLTGHSDTIPCLAMSPDGTIFATGSRDGDIRLWDGLSGEMLRVLDGHESDVMSVTFHPDGNRLVSASYDKTIRIWNLQHTAPPRILKGHLDWVFTAAVRERELISGSRDGTVRLWDLEKESLIEKRERQGNVSRIATMPHGSILAVATAEGNIRFWNSSLAECLKIIRVDFGNCSR